MSRARQHVGGGSCGIAVAGVARKKSLTNGGRTLGTSQSCWHEVMCTTTTYPLKGNEYARLRTSAATGVSEMKKHETLLIEVTSIST